MDNTQFEDIKERIRKVNNMDSVNEAQTKEWLIKPFFNYLGWDFTDPQMVIPEETDTAGERPDYTFIIEEQRKLLIEAKKIGTRIDNKILNKKISYCTQANVDFLIITDGQKYSLYYSKISGNTNSKLLKEIDLLYDNIEEIELLSYDSLYNDNLRKYASNIFLFSNVKKALNNIFENPPKDFIKIINNKIKENIDHRLEENELKETIKKLTITLDYDPEFETENENIIESNKESVSKKKYPVEKMNNEEWNNTKNLYENLINEAKERNIDVEVKKTKLTINWQKNENNICEFVPQKSGLKVFVDIKFNDLTTEEAIKFEDASGKGKWGTGDSQCYIRNETDFEWFFPIIKKLYNEKETL